MRITNSILFVFCRCRHSSFCGNGSAFQAGDFSGVFVRRSPTYGYGSYCLSGRNSICQCANEFNVRMRWWNNCKTSNWKCYYLSGKGGAVNWRPRLWWIFVFEYVFWLGKPNFHNRRIHSAGLINIGNLPGRQNFSYVGADIFTSAAMVLPFRQEG